MVGGGVTLKTMCSSVNVTMVTEAAERRALVVIWSLKWEDAAGGGSVFRAIWSYNTSVILCTVLLPTGCVAYDQRVPRLDPPTASNPAPNTTHHTLIPIIQAASEDIE